MARSCRDDGPSCRCCRCSAQSPIRPPASKAGQETRDEGVRVSAPATKPKNAEHHQDVPRHLLGQEEHLLPRLDLPRQRGRSRTPRSRERRSARLPAGVMVSMVGVSERRRIETLIQQPVGVAVCVHVADVLHGRGSSLGHDARLAPRTGSARDTRRRGRHTKARTANDRRRAMTLPMSPDCQAETADDERALADAGVRGNGRRRRDQHR